MPGTKIKAFVKNADDVAIFPGETWMIHTENTSERKNLHSTPAFGTPDEEVEDERLWQEKFAASGNFLAQLSANIQQERSQGLLFPLDTIFED